MLGLPELSLRTVEVTCVGLATGTELCSGAAGLGELLLELAPSRGQAMVKSPEDPLALGPGSPQLHRAGGALRSTLRGGLDGLVQSCLSHGDGLPGLLDAGLGGGQDSLQLGLALLSVGHAPTRDLELLGDQSASLHVLVAGGGGILEPGLSQLTGAAEGALLGPEPPDLPLRLLHGLTDFIQALVHSDPALAELLEELAGVGKIGLEVSGPSGLDLAGGVGGLVERPLAGPELSFRLLAGLDGLGRTSGRVVPDQEGLGRGLLGGLMTTACRGEGRLSLLDPRLGLREGPAGLVELLVRAVAQGPSGLLAAAGGLDAGFYTGDGLTAGGEPGLETTVLKAGHTLLGGVAGCL